MSEHRRTRMPTAHRAGGVVLCTTGGGAENSRKNTYSPLSSRAKRGDPVNKKKHCGRTARRHIALDCHSRTPTFSTLIVLLRNDRGRAVMTITTPSQNKVPLCGGVPAGRGGVPRRWRGHYLHSKLSTLNSIIPAPAGIIKKIRRTADSPHTEYKPDSVPPWAPFPTPSVASIISLHTMLPRCVYALYPPPCARDSLQGPI